MPRVVFRWTILGRLSLLMQPTTAWFERPLLQTLNIFHNSRKSSCKLAIPMIGPRQFLLLEADLQNYQKANTSFHHRGPWQSQQSCLPPGSTFNNCSGYTMNPFYKTLINTCAYLGNTVQSWNHMKIFTCLFRFLLVRRKWTSFVVIIVRKSSRSDLIRRRWLLGFRRNNF